MAYLAIARKYRPSTFDEIVGQDHVTRTLKNAIEKGRIHHAYLFTGARGVGKTTAARALARALNCVEGPTANPCGVCVNCVEILAGTFPDLMEIDGASNNSVDNIRELRDTVKYAPARGRYKVYLIDEVHMLSKSAFNALLKTLEEPPPQVVFLFATTESNKIPETILSRVQRFDFKRIPQNAVVEHLKGISAKEGAQVSDTGLRMIARAGEGSMRDAQSLLDKVISFGGREVSDREVAETLGLIDRGLLYEMVEGMVGADPQRCLEAIERVHDYGFELSQFTQELLEVVRNATFFVLSPQAQAFVDVSEDEKERLRKIAQGADAEVLTRLFDALLEVHDQVSRAARPRIVLDMAAVRLSTRRPLVPLPQLLGRLEQLEQRLRAGGGGPGGVSGRRPGGPAGGTGPSGPGPSGGSRGAPEARGAEAPEARASQRPAELRAPEGSQAGAIVKEGLPEVPRPGGPTLTGPTPAQPPILPKTGGLPLPSPNQSPVVAAPQDDFRNRWEGLKEAWIELLGDQGKDLVNGVPSLDENQLVIEYGGVGNHARALRALKRPEATTLFREWFPGVEGPIAREVPQEGAPVDRPSLRRQAETDPRLQLVLRALGGRLIDVRPLKKSD